MDEQTLMKKYPKIFRQKDLSMKETAMYWGVECGPGWYNLIDTLCYSLQKLTDKKGHPQVEFTQVKEKFGSLRIYTQGGSDLQWELISFAEDLSKKICEKCGKPGQLRNDGWMITLCDDCQKRRDNG